MHIWISLVTEFQSKRKILIFWIKFTQKGYFRSKITNVNTTIKFCIFKLILVPNFSLNWQFWFFGPNLLKKSISSTKQKKWTPPLNSSIQINLGTKSQLKLAILTFWTKFSQKGIPDWKQKKICPQNRYFRSKTVKVNITIEFYIFELV